VNIFITSAAGYIGNHCMLKLAPSEYSLFGLDTIKPEDTSIFRNFYVGDHGNTIFMQSILKGERIEYIIHASGSSNVKDTIEVPIKYYCNDLMGTTFLLRTVLENNVKKMIFLSSAQVYGNVTQFPATENMLPNLINPLGKIKFAIEQPIESPTFSHDLHAVILRISNVIGMDSTALVCPENDDLLSNILFDNSVNILSHDCTTKDHTPERDFIHVNDVAQAIISALLKLNFPRKYFVYNIFSGRTTSVKNIIQIGEKVTYKPIATSSHKRRNGEIERLSLDPSLARRELDWRLQYPSLEYMIESANDWLKSHGGL
jgi:UDP-glucose 4-epimerase